jgi:glycosyltransferase involved in cell wall biosynthesis
MDFAAAQARISIPVRKLGTRLLDVSRSRTGTPSANSLQCLASILEFVGAEAFSSSEQDRGRTWLYGRQYGLAGNAMNVLHVIPGIALRYGGPSQAIRFMCSALAEHPDMKVVLATTDADGAGGRVDKAEVPTDIPTHVFRRTWSERWKYSRPMASWLRNHVRDFDLVHIHALWSHAPYAAAREARRAGVPYIVRPAGMLAPYSLGRRAILKQFSWWLAERRIVEEATAFHATTSAEADDIRSVWPQAKVFVIPNGVDDVAFTAPTERDPMRRGLFEHRQTRPIVLFLSRLHPKKGIVDLLLPAFAELPLRPLLILAGGPDEHDPGYAALVERTIEKLALQDDVIVWGSVAANERWKLFDAADLFVLQSHSENFGIVVAEAMARGCPVLLTDQVQLQDEVLAARAGIVVPCRVDAIRDELQRFMTQPELWASLGTRGKAYAFNQFQWARIGGQLAKMYQSHSSQRHA